MLVWITGLPGSGKTTLAKNLLARLENSEIPCISLDGDHLRSILPMTSIYNLDERKKLSNFYANLASSIESKAVTVICSFVALFSEARKIAQEKSTNYHEVFIDPPLESLKGYNKKNLYQSLRSESIQDQIENYEFPETPDLLISETVDNSNINEYTEKVYMRIIDDIKFKKRINSDN